MSDPKPDVAPERVFLVVVDDTPEVTQALHWAGLRAAHTGGRIALLHVVEPVENQQWMAVEELMRAERRAEAEAVLSKRGAEALDWSGRQPILFIREGNVRDELLALIEQEAAISVLVLGAGTGKEGPGPLVSHLAGKMSGRLRIPIVLVPGILSDEQLRMIA
ncbi:MAG: universal stress protein [Alphaproteobacteria bacterium]|nr:universal stress protein [Alphaproteobacteria bacterium]TAD88313.1 MAG: universal stress protein [Alphaproteobacteria bacterium]